MRGYLTYVEFEDGKSKTKIHGHNWTSDPLADYSKELMETYQLLENDPDWTFADDSPKIKRFIVAKIEHMVDHSDRK